MRPQTKSDPAPVHRLSGLQDAPFPVEKNHINRKLHAPGVDAFTGHDPKTLARRQAGVLQQTSPPLRTGVGDCHCVSELCVAPGCVPNAHEITRQLGTRKHGHNSGTWPMETSAIKAGKPVAGLFVAPDEATYLTEKGLLLFV